MLSAVITALLFVVMLLLVTNLVVGAGRERQRHKHTQAQRASAATHPLIGQTTALVQVQDTAIFTADKAVSSPAFILPSSWYVRRRALVTLGFLVMILLTLFVQDGLKEGTGALQTLSKGVDSTFLGYSKFNNGQTTSHPLLTTASTRLVRIDSASRNQYHTDYQWQVWSYSSCSGIAMEMVMNAYGRHLIAADVLQQELNLGVWNVSLGLLRDEGIAMTASYFGFNTSANRTRTLQDLINISNQGAPVIVSVRNSYYYPGGHLFVVRGGNSQYVYIADSSPANFQRMSHSMFLGMWQGFSAVLTPR